MPHSFIWTPAAHVRLGRRELELDDPDLGLFDASRAAGRGDDILVQEHAVHQLGVVNGATDLLDEADVAQVDVVGFGGDEAEDRVDGDGSEDGGVLRDDLLEQSVSSCRESKSGRTHLGRETGGSGTEEVIPFVQVDGRRHVLQVLDHLCRRPRERLGDDGRVDTLAEQLLRRTEKRTRENDDRSRAVSRLNVLRCREVDELDQRSSASVRLECEAGQTMRAAGCRTLMCLRMVAPSFVMTTSPCAVWIILSIPRGPKEVRTASATAASDQDGEVSEGVR